MSITATPVVSYDCGCGFRADTWAKAEVHATTTRHNLTIHGRVIVDTPDGEAIPLPPRQVRRKWREDGGDES